MPPIVLIVELCSKPTITIYFLALCFLSASDRSLKKSEKRRKYPTYYVAKLI